MIEVVRLAEGWTWTMIGVCGRVLAYTGETFASDVDANNAAKGYRSHLWALSSLVDARMGACI